MNKYYNKKIPNKINCVYGGRHYGKTYYEFIKLEEKCEYLQGKCDYMQEKNEFYKNENFNWLKRYERLVNRIGRAVKLLEDGSGNNVEDAINILRGEK